MSVIAIINWIRLCYEVREAQILPCNPRLSRFQNPKPAFFFFQFGFGQLYKLGRETTAFRIRDIIAAEEECQPTKSMLDCAARQTNNRCIGSLNL